MGGYLVGDLDILLNARGSSTLYYNNPIMISFLRMSVYGLCIECIYVVLDLRA
jgi:hypothetical protein